MTETQPATGTQETEAPEGTGGRLGTGITGQYARWTQRLFVHEHAALRVVATEKGMPLTEYVRTAVLEKMARDGVTP